MNQKITVLLSLVTIATVTLSCNTNHHTTELSTDKSKTQIIEITGNGLTGNEEFEALHISRNNDIYLAGETDLNSDVPIIMKSTDNGNNWKNIYSEGNGKIIKLYSNDSVIYAVKFNFVHGGESQSELLVHDKQTSIWKNISAEYSLIRNVQMIGTKNIFVQCVSDNKENYKFSNDGGILWFELDKFSRNSSLDYENITALDSSIFGFYSPNPRRDTLNIFKFNLLNHKFETNTILTDKCQRKIIKVVDNKIQIQIFRENNISLYGLSEILDLEFISEYEKDRSYDYCDLFFDSNNNETLFLLNSVVDRTHFNSYTLATSSSESKTMHPLEDFNPAYLGPYDYIDNHFIAYMRHGKLVSYKNQ